MARGFLRCFPRASSALALGGLRLALLWMGLAAGATLTHFAGADAALHTAVSAALTRGEGHTLTALQQQAQQRTSMRMLAAVANPCFGVRCPGSSRCQGQGGAPTCICPAATPHLVNGRCLGGPLLHADYLDPHNSARAALGVGSLVWNGTLAASATAWARTLTTCALHHPKGSPFGQNLASVWGDTTKPPSFGIGLWINEAADYSFSVFPGGCRPGAVCGHYTQLIWANTKQVGCGKAPCTRDGAAGVVWACDYFPPGNYLGQLPYTRDPCFQVACPSTSRCVSMSGAAVCQCAAGLALVNGACQQDPCRGHVCPGNKVCSAATGKVTCVCSPGKVASAANPNMCSNPECAGVVCSPGASCRGMNGVPVCTCPPGASMIGNVCSRVPGVVSSTSLAVYKAPGYKGAPAVIRVSPKCVNLPPGYAGNVQSMSVLWEAKDPSTAPGSTKTTCTTVYFWDKPNCCCEGWGPQAGPGQVVSQYPNTLDTAAMTYAPKAAVGYSVSCAV